MRDFFKKNNILLCFVINIILYLVFDWLLWDIQAAIHNPPPAGALLGIILISLLVLAGILAIVYVIRMIKKSPVKALLPVFILALIIFFQFSIEYTEWYARLNYNLLKNDRKEVVLLFFEGKISQIGSAKYLLPSRFRLSSKTKCVYSTSGEEISFAIRPGFQGSYLFYVEEDNAFPKGFEWGKFVTIRKLDEHWYWALVQ